MASTKQVAFLAVVVLLLQASWCAVARHHRHGAPSPAETQGAVMVVTSFERDGGGPSACDGHYHSNADSLVALSTKWYAGGSRCHRSITIRSKSNGRTAVADVVDECRGCPDNLIATSVAVWDALGGRLDIGQDSVFWSISDDS